MNSIYVTFNLKSFTNSLESNDLLDKNYQSVYKPLIKFLYSHPDFPFSFSFSGTQIQFFKKRKNELITILREMVDRKQVEVLGGGYYDPVLPLLYPVDRNGQIDMLSSEIRQTVGKRPRGISIFADCWDSSLVNNIHTCGIEYVLLDSNLIPDNKRKFIPIIMTDLNKSVDIYPYSDELLPSKDTSPEEFITRIIKATEKIDKKDSRFQLDVDRIVNLNFSHDTMVELTASKWFDKLESYLKENSFKQEIKLTTIVEYKKLVKIKEAAYIPAGINSSIAKWIDTAFTEKNIKNPRQYTVFDFMDTYSSCHALYSRIMYTSMLVNQYKGDKMRKKAAREKLWQAQNGAGLICSDKGVFANSRFRHQSYKNLMEAEKILREDGKFKESITCFDYDNDGLDEYVCRMENIFAYISLISGAVQELEVIKNTGNYADNLQRREEYDGVSDDYKRGFFVDHLFTQDQFNIYIHNEPAGDGIFSRIQYSQIKFSQNHHEIQMEAYAIWKPTNQQIHIIKKYIVNSNGMYVQYIIKNESSKPLNAYFAVESNIANTNFNPENIIYHNIELIDNGEKIELDGTEGTAKLLKSKKLQQITTARISDTQSGIAFVFEPNENCGYSYNPIIFKRPNNKQDNIVPVDLTSVSTLFWHIEIEAGMETEKNINFTTIPIKKIKK